jgi:hypothetical protein
MRNIARDLSHKLRHTNAAMAGDRLPRADRGGVSHVPAISN